MLPGGANGDENGSARLRPLGAGDAARLAAGAPVGTHSGAKRYPSGEGISLGPTWLSLA